LTRNYQTDAASGRRPGLHENEALWILVGQAGTIVGALLSIRILTELLSPAAYGELALGMTASTLVSQLILGPLSNGVTRFLSPAIEKNALGAYFAAVVHLVIKGTIAIVAMCLIVVAAMHWIAGTDLIPLVVGAYVFGTLSDYNGLFNGIQTAARRRRLVAVHQVMEATFRLGFAAAYITAFSASSAAAIWGFTSAIVFVLASQVYFFKQTLVYEPGMPGEARKWEWQIWRFSWPFAAWGIFTWAQAASDRWALGVLSSTESVGLYAVLFQLGYYPVSLAAGMAAQLFTPIFYQKAGDGSDHQRVGDVDLLNMRLTRVALGLTSLGVITSYLFHHQLLALFAAPKYGSASFLLPWMVLAGGLFAAGQMRSLSVLTQMKSFRLIYPKVLTAVLAVVVNAVGAYLFGIAGVVSAMVAVSVVYFVWITALAKQTSLAKP
jgi:O-antigen/teichoic acid export membrane protein